MNKTYLIIGGASATSLAVGGVGGYLLAKKKFDATLDGLIALEVQKTKKHYKVLLADAQKLAHAVPVEEDEPLVVEEAEEDEELSEADQETITRGKQALVNYAGFAAKPSLQDVVESNIFTKDAPKKKLPPRDPTGKFRPKQEDRGQAPYLITEEEFLLNDPENEQDSVRYFAGDETAVMESDYNDVVDTGRIGEDNLASFPEDEPSVIYVRNEGLAIDYQITRTYESLTTAMGLGEDDADLDEIDAAEYAHAQASDD